MTLIQVSQEADKVVWYFLLFKNFAQFVARHTVKGFSIVSEAELDVFLELPCFLHDPTKKAMAPHSSTLAWKIPRTEEPGGLQSVGSLRVGHD